METLLVVLFVWSLLSFVVGVIIGKAAALGNRPPWEDGDDCC